MKCYGITGGIGSGKSTICKIFESFGIPIYQADFWASWLMENDGLIVETLKHEFGQEVYLENGKLNRPLLSNIVFQDRLQLDALNALVHPRVAEHSEKWVQAQSNAPYCLREAALMIESGQYKKLDGLILVKAPEELRIRRVMNRNGLSREAVEARIKNQLSESEMETYANYWIINDGSIPVLPQVIRLHEILSQKS